LTGQLVLDPSIVLVGGSATGTVTLSGPAPQGGIAVALSSGNPNIASVPATVTVPIGNNTASFPITAGSTAGTTTIKATLNAASLTGTITVRPKTGKEGAGKEHIGKEIPIEKAAPIEVSPRLTPILGPTNLAGPTLRSTESTPSNQPVTPIAQAFIRPEERPPVGQQIIQPPT
jgi:hypothetical protein